MVRSFSGDPVDPVTLERIISLARHAPTAGNTQGWAVVVMSGPEQTARFWDATTTPAWRASSRRWPGLSKAPAVIAVFCRPGAYLDRYDAPDKAGSGLGTSAGEEAWPVPYWFVDAGFAVMAMLLGAADAGLGTCFLGNFRGEEELRSALGVPIGWRYSGAVLLGKPAGSDPPSSSLDRQRLPDSAVIHPGTWKHPETP